MDANVLNVSNFLPKHERRRCGRLYMIDKFLLRSTVEKLRNDKFVLNEIGFSTFGHDKLIFVRCEKK